MEKKILCLEITGSTKSDYWYSKQIGKKILAVDIGEYGYRMVSIDAYTMGLEHTITLKATSSGLTIRKEDCKVVDFQLVIP